MADRITAVDAIALHKRGVRPRLSESGYLKATAGKTRVPGFGRTRYRYEGFLFPATYDFFKNTPSKQLVGDQLDAFQENWANVNLRYPRRKKLTPYDVLIIASMIEKEAQASRERPLVAAVVYNRLHARMPLQLDATIRYGLDIPPTESLHESQLHDSNPYNTRVHTGLPPTPIANPGLVDPGGRTSGEGRLPLLCPQAGQGAPLFTSSYTAFRKYADAHGYCAGLGLCAAGSPVAHSLAADAERGVRRARPRLAHRHRRSSGARLDEAVSGSRRWFCGANVTAPHALVAELRDRPTPSR
jgi:hypothetical protein